MVEIVEELVEAIDKVLDSPEQSVEVARSVVRHFGGMQIYWPKYEKAFKEIDEAAIYRMYDGTNMREVCRKFNITSPQIYTILQRQGKRHRTQ